MGTNFFTDEEHIYDTSPEFHIGKRSAAGLYCFDCGITLCKGGENKVHSGGEFYETCPKCGQRWVGDALNEGSVALELGFAKPDTLTQRVGVRPCSSFTWAMRVSQLEMAKEVFDEYHHRFSLQEFVEVLNACPIKFYNSLGHEFS